MRNTKNATVVLITFQCRPMPACCCTMRLSDTLPARMSTGIVDIPMAISYEIIWALERSPPSSEYLLFDDQPASTMPYTPSDEIARMKRKPIGSGASAMSIVPHFESQGAPYGITAQVSSAGRKAITGARTNSGRYACPGYVSSFMMFFTPSATDCSRPCGPTRFGPRRSWMNAHTRRSSQITIITPTI